MSKGGESKISISMERSVNRSILFLSKVHDNLHLKWHLNWNLKDNKVKSEKEEKSSLDIWAIEKQHDPKRCVLVVRENRESRIKLPSLAFDKDSRPDIWVVHSSSTQHMQYLSCQISVFSLQIITSWHPIEKLLFLHWECKSSEQPSLPWWKVQKPINNSVCASMIFAGIWPIPGQRHECQDFCWSSGSKENFLLLLFWHRKIIKLIRQFPTFILQRAFLNKN